MVDKKGFELRKHWEFDICVTCWSSDPEAIQLQPSIHLPVQEKLGQALRFDRFLIASLLGGGFAMPVLVAALVVASEFVKNPASYRRLI